MANAAERLFDSVLRKLAPGEVLDWPRDNDEDSENDPVDEPRDNDDDGIFSIDEEGVVDQVKEQLAGGRFSGQLDGADKEVFEGAVRRVGFDALAFYKSRRMISARPFPGRWGIFYLKQGLVYIESQIALEYPGYSNPRKLALNFLREHERFHYRADLQALLFEATLGRSLYMPLRRALRGRRSHFAEEALANRQVWDWSKKGSIGIEEFAFEFMKLQPNAYARFDEPRIQLAAEWAGTVVGQTPPRTTLRLDLAHWVEASPMGLLRPSLCPEYVIYPARLTRWLDPALVLPPVMNIQEGEEVIKVLEGRLAHLRTQWDSTKAKLLENRLLRGLNFKPWPKDGPSRYSVRVDDNFRAHLLHLGAGRWIAYVLGPHTKLGHG
jgi:hypothetical protein